MRKLPYTVKEVARLAGVTVKTLHHYHRIGLLRPCQVTEAGYRLYGTEELERLQHILFYRELEFPLESIKRLMDGNTPRAALLAEQERLLSGRKQQLERLLATIRTTIQYTEKGEPMDQEQMFVGFKREEEWTEALSEQRKHLEETYGFDLLEHSPVEVDALNEMAAESKTFTDGLAAALRQGLKHSDEAVRERIGRHLAFMESRGLPAGPDDFVMQTRFFLDDDFHRGMLEAQQTGLAYYLNAAAEAYARARTSGEAGE